jgi:hypothetical protein
MTTPGAIDCHATYRTLSRFGRRMFSGSCTICGVPFFGATFDTVADQFAEHAAIPMPPADILAAPLTPAIVRDYPHYYISGRGRPLADRTDCPHRYRLTDSCPGCDHDFD